MRTEYACIALFKSYVEDDYEMGEIGDTFEWDDYPHVTSPTLKNLIQILHVRYGITGLTFNREDSSLVCSRVEDDGGLEATENELSKWRKGEGRLYNATYIFKIERRLVYPVREVEAVNAGIPIV